MWQIGLSLTLGTTLNGTTAGEWLCTIVHVGPRLVDLAVDAALEVHQPPALIDRIGIEVVLHDVVDRDHRRRQRTRQEIAVGRAGMAHAAMAVAIEHTLVGADVIRVHQVLEYRPVDRPARRRRPGADRCSVIHNVVPVGSFSIPQPYLKGPGEGKV
jgi:L-ascorbate metabolism protein UlaG (beta-lactamase superfamily)